MKKLFVLINIFILASFINAFTIKQKYLKGTRVFDVFSIKSKLFFATDKGLVIYENNKLKKIYDISYGLSSNIITSLISYKNNIIGVAFSLNKGSSLFIFNNDKIEIKQKIKGAFKIIKYKDNIIILTINNGIFYTNDNLNNIKKIKYEEFFNKSIIDGIEYNNFLYLASKYNGIYKLQNLNPPFKIINYSEHTSKIISNNTTCLAYDDTNLWIGTQGGISVFNPITNQWNDYWGHQISDNFITSITSYKEFIIIGNKKGITIYNKKQNVWKSYSSKNNPDFPSGIVTGTKIINDNIWILTEQGACIINP